jgi:hypothetical protein
MAKEIFNDDNHDAEAPAAPTEELVDSNESWSIDKSDETELEAPYGFIERPCRNENAHEEHVYNGDYWCEGRRRS